MKIEEIIKMKDKETYNKLMQLRGNYKQCMERKCKNCKKKKECFKDECKSKHK